MQATRTFRIFVSSTFPSTWLTCACGTGAGRAGSDLKAMSNALLEYRTYLERLRGIKIEQP